MNKPYYLAYGSNLNIKQMKYRCPNARKIGTAEIKNYRLLFKGSKTGSYLTIEPSEGDIVPVGVWAISEEDEASLDMYEGFPNFYYKKEITLDITSIRTKKIITRKCLVYIMREDRPVGIPSEYYMRVCLEGYYNFGFNSDTLLRAYDESKEEYHENE